MAKVKKFRWEIDESDETQGVKVISLVDEPAMESNFIAFKKQKVTPKYVAFATEQKGYKQVVAGLALIPEKEIPRIDENGNEYVGYFTADTIEQIRNKFHKEHQDQNVNTDHESSEDVEAYLVESFIVSSEKQAEDLRDKGIKEASIGSWFVAYKIEDKEVFEKVLSGEYNGFSVELFADRILESFKYNYNYNKNKFNMKDLLEKFKAIINEFEKEEVQEEPKVEKPTEELEKVSLERAPVPALEIIIEWNEVGTPVNSVIVDENGEETLEPIDDGEYELEDGRYIVVVDGVLAEVRDAAPATTGDTANMESAEYEDGITLRWTAVGEPVERVEVVDGEEKADVLADGEYSLPDGRKIIVANGVLESIVEPTQNEKEEPLEEVVVKSAKETLIDLGIDFSQDGYWMIEVGVENGEPVYGSIMANTYKEMKFKVENFEAKEQEIVDLKKEVEELKAKIKEPIAEPRLGSEEEEEIVDLSKLSNYERIARKNGIQIV